MKKILQNYGIAVISNTTINNQFVINIQVWHQHGPYRSIEI